MRPLEVARAAIKDHGAIQKEAELAGFLAVLLDEQPEVIVEIGSAVGGTLYAWQQLPTVRRVIGVDMPHGRFSREGDLDSHGCEVVIGDSHDPATVHLLEDVLGTDPLDVLFIDGDHTYHGVKSDHEMYEPLVRPGGLVAFHDVCPHHGIGISWNGVNVDVDVDLYWRQLEIDGADCHSIITDPYHWGGIGWIRKEPACVP